MAQIKRKNPPVRKRMAVWHTRPTVKSKVRSVVSAFRHGVERTTVGLENFKKSDTMKAAGKVQKWGVETQKGREKALNKLMEI